jgi:hypothetical protein
MMLMDDAMGFEREQDDFVLFPIMSDTVYDGVAFSLEDIMEPAALMKLFAGSTATRNLLHVEHLGATSHIFHVRMDIPAEQTHWIDLQRQRPSLNDHSGVF